MDRLQNLLVLLVRPIVDEPDRVEVEEEALRGDTNAFNGPVGAGDGGVHALSQVFAGSRGTDANGAAHAVGSYDGPDGHRVLRLGHGG